MLRIVIATCLISVSSACFAQVVQEVKPTTLGGGCEAPANILAPKLAICTLADNKARVWCPNGKVFERRGFDIQPALARSICGLNQAL